jgi:hypothetical protein
MAIEIEVERAIKLTMPVLELSGAAPAAACTSRATSGLPSVRKRPSETYSCAPLGQREMPNCIMA